MMSVQSSLFTLSPKHKHKRQRRRRKKQRKKRRIIQSDNIKYNSFEMLNPNVLGIKSIKFLMPNDKLENESRWWRAQRTFIECHASFDESMECQTYVCHATGGIIVNRNQVDVNVRSENKNRKQKTSSQLNFILKRFFVESFGLFVETRWWMSGRAMSVCVWVWLCVIYVLRSQLFVILTIIKNHNKRTRQLFVSLHRQHRTVHTHTPARAHKRKCEIS